MTYKFWSYYDPRGGWLCIPPDESFLPGKDDYRYRGGYPINAIRKHEVTNEFEVPFASFWDKPYHRTWVVENGKKMFKIQYRTYWWKSRPYTRFVHQGKTASISILFVTIILRKVYF